MIYRSRGGVLACTRSKAPMMYTCHGINAPYAIDDIGAGAYDSKCMIISMNRIRSPLIIFVI